MVQREHSISGSDAASGAPKYQQCPSTSRMASLPTLGVGLLCTTVAAPDDSGSRCPALLEGIDMMDVHTACVSYPRSLSGEHERAEIPAPVFESRADKDLSDTFTNP